MSALPSRALPSPSERASPDPGRRGNSTQANNLITGPRLINLSGWPHTALLPRAPWEPRAVGLDSSCGAGCAVSALTALPSPSMNVELINFHSDFMAV